MIDLIKREIVYIAWYFSVQFWRLAPYWCLGITIGSIVSTFFKRRINDAFGLLQKRRIGVWGIAAASGLGILSPLCMYGTVPVAASFSKSGAGDDLLAAFMTSSVLLNPQLIVYTSALGLPMAAARVIVCFICGISAGLLIRVFYRGGAFFDFKDFSEPINRDVASNPVIRLIKNMGRNVRATGLWFLFGILLSALFQRYVPQDSFAALFGKHKGFGVLTAAAIGVPLYACGGSAIPLLQSWLKNGMSVGAAAAFMITGQATKLTNAGAIKIVLGAKKFALYFAFIITFALVSGFCANFALSRV